MKSRYKFESEVWLYPSETAAWHMTSVPKEVSEEIKKNFGKVERGWGSLRVSAKAGKTTWPTSIFWDKRSGVYILPLKAAVRKKEGIMQGEHINVDLSIIIERN